MTAVRRTVALLAIVALAAAACSGSDGSAATTTGAIATTEPAPATTDPAVATTAPATAPPTSTAPPTTSPRPLPPDHRIAVQVIDGLGQFVDTATGERFVPRGMNYNRFLPGATLGVTDNVFTVDDYDPATVDADLAAMQALGFNAVRVMIETCDPGNGCIGTGPAGRELNAGYLDNVADFLARAEAHAMVVLLASNTLPDDSWWLNETGRLQTDQFGSSNNEFLNPAAVPLYVDYWTKVVTGLVERGAATDAILGYELRQEHHFDSLAPPLSLDRGLVTTANGSTYDMADPAAKAAMVDEGLVYWSDLLRSAIRSIDPTALVTVGFFTPNEPHQVNGPNETRLVRTAYFLRNAQADFVDLHHYAGNGVDDADIWENFGLDGVLDKPLVLGEHGAFRTWYGSAASGAAAVMSLEVEACRVGFDGYLVWAWRGDLSDDLWWASEGDGEIAQVVAPVNRPDPCEYGEFPFVVYNVALGATATASSEIEGAPATNVNDGRTDLWNAADVAPQWVELALAEPAVVSRFSLRVAQDPPGHSTHELWVERVGGTGERLHVFDGVTRENEVLDWVPDEPITDVVVVRVVTTSLEGGLAPAWHEIELFSTDPPASG